jgi:predicted site-specific integrase-resolvase
MLDGELLLDNQDLCQLLHVSKRTLQRYRSTGELPFQTVYQKTYYKESDVHTFIRENFNKGKDNKKSENPEDANNP